MNGLPQIVEKLTRTAEHAVGRLKVSTALNSVLWLCGIICPLGMLTACYVQGWVQIAILTLTFLPILLFATGFLYFLLRDPDKLRSEDFEIRKQALELIEEKGGKIPMLETSVTDIANPEYRALPESREGADR